MTALSVAPTYADDADSAGDPNRELLAELEEARTQLADYRAAFDAIALVCNAAAKGDLEPRVPHLGDGAVVADVRKQLNQLLDLTDAFVRESSASLEYASSGRFFRRFLVRGMHGSFKAGADIINQATASMAEADGLLKESAAQRLRMADEFEHAVLAVAEHVAAAATEMEASSRGVANTADHTSSRAADAGRGANEAASGVASVAAAVEELVSTVGEIQRQAQESNTAGARAAEEAAQARETMRGLESAAHEIGQIVTVINAVSSQTRLLALNATIEAARAGTAGKGFAVVASEVKELAAQTASSTDQIAAQVAAIQEATAQAALAIDGVTNTVREISVGSEQIAQAVGEQRAATTEMSRNTQEVAQATNDVTRNVEQVTVGTSETSAAAEQMTAAASELSGLAEKLRTEVDLFLRNIRA